MSESVSFPTNACTVTDVAREHCADLTTRMDCSDRSVCHGLQLLLMILMINILLKVTKTVRINKVICDQSRQARYCHRVP